MTSLIVQLQLRDLRGEPADKLTNGAKLCKATPYHPLPSRCLPSGPSKTKRRIGPSLKIFYSALEVTKGKEKGKTLPRSL